MLLRAAAWMRAFAFLDDTAPAALRPQMPITDCHGPPQPPFLQPSLLPDRRPRTGDGVQPGTVRNCAARSLARAQGCARRADHKRAGACEHAHHDERAAHVGDPSHEEPAASYSPRPLRAKYHRR
jgi:hypothetical protein